MNQSVSVKPKGGYPRRKVRGQAARKSPKKRRTQQEDLVTDRPSHTWMHSLLPTPKQPPNHSTGTLSSIQNPTTNRLSTLSDRVDNRTRRATHIVSVVVFALALGAVDAFLGEGVAHGCEQTILADLAGNETVDAVLKGIDLLDACYFGLVEGV